MKDLYMYFKIKILTFNQKAKFILIKFVQTNNIY